MNTRCLRCGRQVKVTARFCQYRCPVARQRAPFPERVRIQPGYVVTMDPPLPMLSSGAQKTGSPAIAMKFADFRQTGAADDPRLLYDNNGSRG
jgi:hypothetical protein